MATTTKNQLLSCSRLALLVVTTFLLHYPATGSGIRSRKIKHFSLPYDEKSQDALNLKNQQQKEGKNLENSENDHKRQLSDLLGNLENAVDTMEDIANAIDSINEISDNLMTLADTLDGTSTPCFSAHNDVEVQGKGMVPMNLIKVGDYVRVFSHKNHNNHKANNIKGADGDNNFSRVFSLAHLDHNLETDFLQIHYDVHKEETNGKRSQGVKNRPLEITKKHMLYVLGKGVVSADEVKIGDVLLHHNDATTKNSEKVMAVVSNIQSTKRKGVYAPITESGHLIVSGVLASSYYAFLDGVPSNVQHTLTHFFFAPHRTLCSYYDFGLCENETHSEGYTNWAYWAIQIMAMINKTIVWTPIQCMLALISCPILLTIYTLEQAIMVIANAFTGTSSVTTVLVPLTFAYGTTMLSKQNKSTFV